MHLPASGVGCSIAAPLPPPLSIRERYTGLLTAALLGDSLALAPHWIYDQAKIKSQFGRVDHLLAPPLDGYHAGKGLGAQTHYGDQTLVLMDSLEACGGNFVMNDFAQRWQKFWKDSTSYRDHATKETLAHLVEDGGLTRAGSDSTELGGPARIAPLLLALREEDEPTIIAAVRAQTALTHASPIALDTAEFIARTIFLILRGISIPSALRDTADLPYKALPAAAYLKRAKEVSPLPILEAVEQLGQSCPMDKALPAAFALLLKYEAHPEEGLMENVMAGGDSAARALVLGMILGAAHGHRAVPERWLKDLQARHRVKTFLQAVGLGTGL